MSALLAAGPLLLRRRSALADLLPVIAFAVSTAVIATVLGGTLAFAGRLPAGPVDAGASDEASVMGLIVMFAVIACVLLVPSAVSFGAGAARLSLARRDRDLAAMRLVGGTTGQVAGIAVLDVLGQALLGAVLGIGLHLLVTPPLTALDFGFAPFTVGELLLPAWAYPLLVLGVLLVAAASGAVALTGIVLSPLGVARASRTVRMSVLRVAVWVLLVVGLFGLMQLLPIMEEANAGLALALLVGMIGAVVAGVNVVGPFTVWLVARILAALAPWPALLVGARRLAADPRAGWRAVSGITFALVVAGLLMVVVTLGGPTSPAEEILFTAMATGGILTLAIAAVIAAVSTGVTQAARVIDHAPALRAQHVAGAEVAQLHRARLLETAIPLALSSVLATGTMLLVIVAVMGGPATDARGALLYGGSVLAAYLLVLGAVAVSSPLVARGARGARRTV